MLVLIIITINNIVDNSIQLVGGKGSFTLLPPGKVKQSPERDCFLASRCRGGPTSCVYWSAYPVAQQSVRICCAEGRAPVAEGSLDRRATLYTVYLERR